MIQIMNGQWHTIRTSADIESFQNTSNGLHDGYITHVEYNNNGISVVEHGLCFDYTGLSLVIHVLVTSLPDHPTFEISFCNIYEWQINSFQFSDITGFSILILDNGTFLWADDVSCNIDNLKQGSYVVAESIQYRLLT